MQMDDENNIVPVGRLDVDLSDSKAVEELLLMDNVSAEIKEYLLRVSEMAKNNPGSENLTATIFSQTLLPKSRSSETSTYKTYNGISMRSDRVIITNGNSGTKRFSGSTALTMANAVQDIVLIVAGQFAKTIGFGSSLLDIFEAANGNVAHSATGDYVEIGLTYDCTTQWTYGNYDGENWYLGYVSQKVTVKKVDVEEYFEVEVSPNVYNGKTHNFSFTANQTVKSSAFDSPWEKAYYNMTSPIDEYVSFKIYNKTFYFT